MKKKLTLAVFALAVVTAGAFLVIKNYQGNSQASLYRATALTKLSDTQIASIQNTPTPAGIPTGPVVTAPLSCPASGYKFVTKWGTQGSGDGQFEAPIGIAVDRTNHFVYVVDNRNVDVQKFTENGVYVSKWGARIPLGQSLGQVVSAGFFDTPQWLAVDVLGNLYVSDTAGYSNTGPIQKFSNTGSFLGYIGGGRGTGNGQVSGSQGIAIDQNNNVYVADNAANGSLMVAKKITKFTSSGTYSTQWGSYGTGNGQFLGPSGVAVAPNGDVYVTDFLSVKKFTSSGVFITKFGSPGTGNGQFGALTGPTSVAVDTIGNVYVVDNNNSRIQKFTATGNYVTQWGTQGSGNGEFFHPNGIAVDSGGNVYVVDTGNYRVQKFAPCKPTPTPQLAIKSISGKVYVDADRDGRYDAGESFLQGRQVALYKSGQANPIQTVQPQTNGVYTFSGLSPGTYYVGLLSEAFTSFTQPQQAPGLVANHSYVYTVVINNADVTNQDFGLNIQN